MVSWTLQRPLTVTSFYRSAPRLALTYGELNPSAPFDSYFLLTVGKLELMTFYSKVTFATARPLDRLLWSEIVLSYVRENYHFWGIKTHFSFVISFLFWIVVENVFLCPYLRIFSIFSSFLLKYPTLWGKTKKRYHLKKIPFYCKLVTWGGSENPIFLDSFTSASWVAGVGGGTNHIYIYIYLSSFCSDMLSSG